MRITGATLSQRTMTQSRRTCSCNSASSVRWFMDKYMRAAVIGAAIIVLAFILVCLLFPLTGKAQGDVRPQILVVYDHKVPSGTIVGEAKARVILGLRQADPEKRLAPKDTAT